MFLPPPYHVFFVLSPKLLREHLSKSPPQQEGCPQNTTHVSTPPVPIILPILTANQILRSRLRLFIDQDIPTTPANPALSSPVAYLAPNSWASYCRSYPHIRPRAIEPVLRLTGLSRHRIATHPALIAQFGRIRRTRSCLADDATKHRCSARGCHVLRCVFPAVRNNAVSPDRRRGPREGDTRLGARGDRAGRVASGN